MGPTCFDDNADCSYGPWHPISFRYHMVKSTDEMNYDEHCIMIAKFWIREKSCSGVGTIEVSMAGIETYYNNNNLESKCDECKKKFDEDINDRQYNIKRAFSLLLLSGQAMVGDGDWTAGDEWNYEVSKPKCLNLVSDHDYYVQRVPAWNIDGTLYFVNGALQLRDSICQGIHTANFRPCENRCCKLAIKTEKRNVKDMMNFDVLSQTITYSDDRKCMPDCKEIDCNNVAEIDLPGEGTFYPDVIEPVKYDGWGNMTNPIPNLKYIIPPASSDSTGGDLPSFNTYAQPNPASNSITITTSGMQNGIVTIEIYDSFNNLIKVITFDKTLVNSMTTVDLSDFPSGSYFYRVTIGIAPNTMTTTGSFIVYK